MLEKKSGSIESTASTKKSHHDLTLCLNMLRQTFQSCTQVYKPGAFEWANGTPHYHALNVATNMLDKSIVEQSAPATKRAAKYYYRTFMEMILDYTEHLGRTGQL